MKYPFTFTVRGYDHESEYLESGVSICESFTDATNILEKRYGDELIAIKHIELYEESTVITLPKNIFEEVIDCLDANVVYQSKCDEKGIKISDAEI